MLATLLVVTLSAAPTAAQATSFAKAKNWEELYLGFATATPESASKNDRPKIASALLQGCLALQGDDPVMAYSLGERSVAFTPSADALFCTALTAKRSEQRGAAEDALRKGAATYVKDGRFGLELGRLYLEDGQPGEAAAALSKVPPKSKESTEAKRLLAGVTRESGSPVENAAVTPRTGREVVEFRGQPPDMPRSTSLSYETSVDETGRRVRQNQYFRIRYFNQKRDFGDRAEYEGRVQGALEESRQNVQRLLGVAREKTCDVILYSREEFRLHHGPQAAQAIAGFYGGDAIRMNDSAEINPQNRAVLVHEYVHAVMDEIINFRSSALPVWLHEGTAEFIEWQYLGSDDPPRNLAVRLQQLALGNQLPSLTQLNQGPLVGMSNPGLLYALSAVAVKQLVARRGMPALVEFMRDCGNGTPFAQALENHYGLTMERLDEELASTLKSK